MKRIFISILALSFVATPTMAEDVLQILPQELIPGNTMDEDNVFTIEMNNEHTFVALQFDLWLPEGVEIEKSCFELNTDRFPSYTVRKIEYPYHSLTCVKQPQGQFRITCYSTEAESEKQIIKGNSGKLFDVYYDFDADTNFKGILPVKITDIVLVINGNTDVKPETCNSSFYTPGFDFSSLTSIDLTSAEGVTTQDVAAEIRTLMTNPNSLIYLNEGSSAEGLNNVIVGDVCENLVLTDGNPFNAPKAFTASKATYSRDLTATGWYSLCLPFAAKTPKNVTVEHFESLDLNNAQVVFGSGNVGADVPCIFKTETAGNITFEATDAEIAVTAQELTEGCMIGTYEQITDLDGFLALKPNGSGFAKTASTAKANPFRAFLNAPGAQSQISIRHDGETGIEEIETEKVEDYPIFDISGICVKTDNAKNGFFIKGNKVQFIK